MSARFCIVPAIRWIPWPRLGCGGRLVSVSEVVSVGDVVKVVVLEVDEKKKRIGLSMKQAK